MAKAEPKTPVVFRDTAYKSRSIVLANGTMHRVVHGHITAASPELIAHLDGHAEFQRVPVVRAAA